MEFRWLYFLSLATLCLAAEIPSKLKSRAPVVQQDETPSSSVRPAFSGVKGRKPSTTTTTTMTTEAPTTTPEPEPTTAEPQPQVQVNDVESSDDELAQVQQQLSEEERQEELQKTDEALNQYLRETFESVRPKMKEGFAESDYEVLDPLALDDMNLKPIVAGEEFDVRMKKLTVGGISDFDITQLESQLKESRFKIGLYFPKIYANCLFDANGTLYDIFKVTGKGNATLIFKEVHARSVIYLSKENGTLKATTADQPYIDFSSAEILFRDDSVKGGEPIKADSVATQLGPLYFWVLTAQAVDKIDYPMALYLNDALRKFPLPPSLQDTIFRQRHLRIRAPINPAAPYAQVSSL